MSFSLVPALFAVEVIAIAYATQRAMESGALNRNSARWIYGLLALLALWGGLSTYLGLTGAYRTTQFWGVSAPFWLPFVPVLLVFTPFLFSSPARDAINGLIDHTPLHAIVALQGLRVLALGGIIKGWNGEFNAAFAFVVGIPDFLFGASALILASLVFQDRVSRWPLIAWNLIGAAIIVPGSFIVIKLALPGPWQVFTSEPSIATLYEFPMALAPTLVVPILVLINLLLALRLFERGLGRQPQARLRRRAGAVSAGASGSAKSGSSPVMRRAPLPKVR